MQYLIQPLQYLTNPSGEKTGVVLKIADFERIMEDLEDLEDLADIVDRRKEPTISHSAFIEELRKDGLLPD